MVETIYIAICGILIPLFVWGQLYDARVFPFIFVSSLYGVYLLLGGWTLPFDSITIATIAMAMWLSASLLWTKTDQSKTELLTWLSYLMVFTASRVLPIEIVLFSIIPIGAVMGCLQLYRRVTKKHTFLPIFGNSTHNAVFGSLSLMACVWLAILWGSWLLSILAVVLGVAIVLTKNKGSILALLIGCSVIGQHNVYVLSGVIVSVLFILIYLFKHRKEGRYIIGLRGSYNERLL
ncbi:MAG: hypothetical protein WC208_15860, partial [Gallionella sp.]